MEVCVESVCIGGEMKHPFCKAVKSRLSNFLCRTKEHEG